MFTLIKHVLSIFIWAIVAAAFLIAKSPELFAFWAFLGAVLVLSWFVKFVWKWIVGIFFPTVMIRSYAFFILAILLAGAFAYQVALVPTMNSWGATEGELADQYPIDGFLSDAKIVAFRAVTIDTTPDKVYPLIRQLATEGLLSFNVNIIDLLKNEPARLVFRDLPDIEVGDRFLVGQIVQAQENHSLTLELDRRRFPWSKFHKIYAGYYLSQQGRNQTRVVMKIKADYDGFLAWFSAKYLIELGDYWVSRYQLNAVKLLAEKPMVDSG